MGKVKQMKSDVEVILFDIYHHIGMDRPENHDDIVDFVTNDVAETADPDNWHSDDVAIAFRRFIERLNCTWNLYLLFGLQIVRAYEDDGIEAAVESFKNGGGVVYHWNSSRDNPMSLLTEADGWEDYAQITKKEYDQF